MGAEPRSRRRRIGVDGDLDRVRAVLDRAPSLAAQRHTLRQLGVGDDRVYLDHGLTGTNRSRPGLEQALAALRPGDTLVVPKFRPARALGPRRPSDRRLARRPRRAALVGRHGI
jgi:hypothetical protein